MYTYVKERERERQKKGKYTSKLKNHQNDAVFLTRICYCCFYQNLLLQAFKIEISDQKHTHTGWISFHILQIS